MLRLIVTSAENGEQEEVIFTEDFDTPAADYMIDGWTVDIDVKLDIELPGGFPLESTLKRIS